MSDPGSVGDNVSKGRGIVEKQPFRVVGLGSNDLENGGHQFDDESRSRGRPRVDKTWSQVGKEAKDEGGQ